MSRIKLTEEERKRRRRAYDHQRYLNNKEKVKENNHQYYLKNKDKFREYDYQRRLKNKEKVKEQQRQYYLKNKEIWIAPKEPLSKTKAELIALDREIARLKAIPLEDKIYMKQRK
ncbi:MAG: hypothetical protein C4617_05055 [Candidatus Liberibacter europaeus]|uniref:Uncharacterized protein n=1 Tax=Candidatus Liberibacter europaeus TaxID=744859 RepID=A0A2T4VWI8_9HYPH|nr:hypothetical protein [Candidatus Liberibacter europaeus]PTL86136.1 MAG: hypothetical protein C4617_05055 [Candidatus Liberibacter europaeus]